MFGYVITNQQALNEADKSRYQSAYCGLCHTLGNIHGSSGRLALSYDLAFLNLLLSSLYEGDTPETSGERTCIIHPFKARPWHTSEETAYCADMSIALQYYGAKDKWHDDKNLAGFYMMKLFEKKVQDVVLRYPRQCKVIEKELNLLAEFEANNSTDMEAVSSCFGRLLSEIFDYKSDIWSETLRDIGFYLGKYIYLADAYEDLPKDTHKGNYNPLVDICNWQDYELHMRAVLEDCMAQCSKAFERLPCVQDVSLLRNILYSGVWLRYQCETQNRERKKNKKQKD